MTTRPSTPARRPSLPGRLKRKFDQIHFVRRAWGTIEKERTGTEECMKYVPPPLDTYYRGITVHADRATIWRWLCQMRAAPYSYDWIDNYGRRSPRELTPGLDELQAGQPILVIFEVVGFERDRHITVQIKPGLRWFWGNTCCTFRVEDAEDGNGCRLLMIMTVHDLPSRLAGRTGVYQLRKYFFPWAELVMVHKQFRTFKMLAENQAAEDSSHASDSPKKEAGHAGVIRPR